MRLRNRSPLIIWGDIVDCDENVLGEEVVPDDAAGHLPLVVRHVDGLPRLQMHAGHAAEARPHHVLLHEVKEASGLLEAHGIPVAKFHNYLYAVLKSQITLIFPNYHEQAKLSSIWRFSAVCMIQS